MSSIQCQTSAPVPGNLPSFPPTPSFSSAALIFIGLLGFVLVPALYLQTVVTDSAGAYRNGISGQIRSGLTLAMLIPWFLMGTVTRLRQADFWLQSPLLILLLAGLASGNSGEPGPVPFISSWSAPLSLLAALFCALPWLQRQLMEPDMRRNRDVLSLLFWQNLLMLALLLLAALLPPLVDRQVSAWMSTGGRSLTNHHHNVLSLSFITTMSLSVPLAAFCLSMGLSAIRERRPFPRAIESCILRLAHALLPVVAAATLLMAAILVLLPLASLIDQTPMSASTLKLLQDVMPLLGCILGTLLVLLINASWWRARQATAWQDASRPLAPPHAGVALRLVERSLQALPVLAAFSLYGWWQLMMIPDPTHFMLTQPDYLWIPFFVLPPLLLVYAIGYVRALRRPGPDGWLAGIRPVNTLACWVAITLLVLLNTSPLSRLLDHLYELIHGL